MKSLIWIHLRLKLAYTASDKGGNIPTAFNAANELAVAKFLDKYLDIPDIISMQ